MIFNGRLVVRAMQSFKMTVGTSGGRIEQSSKIVASTRSLQYPPQGLQNISRHTSVRCDHGFDLVNGRATRSIVGIMKN